MIEKIRRALGVAASQPDTTSGRTTYTTWHWRCACGAKGGGGKFSIASDAEHLAQRHLHRHPVGHPTPEIYSIEEELE